MITSAAIIMVIVFGTFSFGKILPVQLVGFGLAAAVLLDATVIRMLLVPAIMQIAGRWNWWPGISRPRPEVRVPGRVERHPSRADRRWRPRDTSGRRSS
jgi:RND superfamily putative drug exporter